ncbi:MAG TPA: MFS transporter, partial [Stellaceae bacterium]|nr:MFS transporter [Stellaceae bacterium]
IFLANTISYATRDLALFMVSRFFSGLGEGAMLAVSAEVAGREDDPIRVFSWIGFFVAVSAGLALYSTPLVVAWLGPSGIFCVIALFAAVSAVTIPWFPSGQGSATRPAFSVIRQPPNLAVLTSLALSWGGASSLWVYASQIGKADGFSLERIGLLLSIGQIVGIAGPPVMGWVAARRGLATVLFGGLVLDLVGAGLFCLLPDALGFAGGAAILSFVAMYIVPSYRSQMAAFDGSGAVVAASVAFFTVGYGAGPFVLGLVLALKDGVPSVLGLASAFYLAAGGALAAALILHRRIQAEQRTRGKPTPA